MIQYNWNKMKMLHTDNKINISRIKFGHTITFDKAKEIVINERRCV